MRRAKIVATIGPASDSLPLLRELVAAGMDVARLNFSHRDQAAHGDALARIRQVAQESGRPVAILQDLAGPKIRTGCIAGEEPVRLEPGKRVTLTSNDSPCTGLSISVGYPQLEHDLGIGARILLDDGRLELKVTDKTPLGLEAEVIHGGLLTNHKGVNLPGTPLSVQALSAKDLSDLSFGLDHHVDAVAMSFVRERDDIACLRQQVLGRSSPLSQPILVAKLERPEALQNLEPILDEAEGVLVARGDLGVEIPPEQVPSIQKHILRQANARSRLTITATQMLESMVHSTRPTRAEASDVANAIFDGSDALMLSGETAVGDYPVEAVRTMARIITDAEAHAAEWGLHPPAAQQATADDALATARAARELAEDRQATAIAVFTRSGRTALLMSKVRPRVPILAFTPEPAVYNRMALLWGVEPYLVPMSASVEDMLTHVEGALAARSRVGEGQQVVLVASLPIGAMGPANFTYLHTIGPKPPRHADPPSPDPRPA